MQWRQCRKKTRQTTVHVNNNKSSAGNNSEKTNRLREIISENLHFRDFLDLGCG
jgi:hypothetical protein